MTTTSATSSPAGGLDSFDAFVATASEIPLPGSGQTPHRLATLADLAGTELSLGRLAEGHADALAILAEADQPGGPGRWGVWAARSPAADLDARPAGGVWVLDGAKAFCSGAGVLDRALVTARLEGTDRLFYVRLDHPGVSILAGTWPSVGMAASLSATVRFTGVPAEAVGPPGFYTDRPGFWFGAVGVAACWAGGARALVDRVARYLAEGEPDSATLADLGVGASAVSAAFAVLDAAGEAIDSDPTDAGRGARRRALLTRQAVHAAGTTVLERVAAAGGARPLCLDGAQSQRAADLYTYLAQHHGGRDAAAIGRLVIEELVC